MGGRTANLKFRRFDKGWTWEFVETKAGGWIAPDVAIGQIREEDRIVAASTWADEHKSAYAKTAAAIEILSIYVPNPTMGLDVVTWMDTRHRFAEILKTRSDLQGRVVVLADDHAADAWGNEFLVNFDTANNSAVVLYWPVPSVTTDRTFSIKAGLAASTVTPGRTAPEVSLTRPAMDACA
jgi:hypothetical protein